VKNRARDPLTRGTAAGTVGEVSPPRVLLIEDEAPLAAALRTGLEAEGFAVEIAGDGTTGLELALEGRFDVLVLDLMLPQLNGFHVCARLREQGISTPVLVLTAKQGEYDESEALDTGADDYLRKPFSFVVLASRLRALLRRGAHGAAELIEVGDLVLDTRQRRCRRGAVDVDLTPREFALVEYLARRAGQTVRKRELLDEVWDFAFEDESNIVEVYVGYLRRKLDTPFGRDSIKTVRGVGYRLEATDA
jgi:DNA-binding response OmpR family regulator